MNRKNPLVEQIVGMLRKAHVRPGQGETAARVCRSSGATGSPGPGWGGPERLVFMDEAGTVTKMARLAGPFEAR